jgi:hypothetical protein
MRNGREHDPRATVIDRWAKDFSRIEDEAGPQNTVPADRRDRLLGLLEVRLAESNT